MQLIVDGLDHVAIVVRDLSASIAWYQRVLGLERKYDDVWGDVPSVLLAPGGPELDWRYSRWAHKSRSLCRRGGLVSA